MIHRLAQMRGDPPIPEIDVTRPALAPTINALVDNTAFVSRQGPTIAQTTALVLKQADAPRDSAVGRETEGTSQEPAPEFVEGDGWIEWKGGECPVPEDTLISYKCRNGFECGTGLAKYYMWGHSSHPRDIIAYKVLP